MTQNPIASMPSTPDLILSTATVDEVTSIRIHSVGSDEVTSIVVSDPAPSLELGSTARNVLALDVLEAVLDEEAWLSAIAASMGPGGWLTLRVPIEGPVAWLDALNLYRYTQDITGLGRPLKEIRMKGWHRHYRDSEMPSLLERSGLEVVSIRREGSPLPEARQFAGLLWGTIAKKDPTAEVRLRRQRERQEDLQTLPGLGPLSTRLLIVARKPE